MKTETETKQIEAVELEQVQGGAHGIVTPFDYWAAWMGAAQAYTLPFSTTPLFPRPFG
jgi:hypothetical protein